MVAWLYLDGYRPEAGAGVGLERWDAGRAPALAENMAVAAGKPVLLEAHLARLAEGCRVLAWPDPDLKALRAVCRALPEKNRLKKGSLRLRWWGGLDRPLLLAQTFPARAQPKAGLVLMTSAVRHYGPDALQSRLKAAQMLSNRLAQAEVQAWADDGLRLTQEGLVAEGAWTNVVALKRGIVRSPPLGQGVLEGVTRAALLAKLRAAGHTVREEPLTRYDLWTADALWLTSSLRGALRVASVDGRRVGQARP